MKIFLNLILLAFLLITGCSEQSQQKNSSQTEATELLKELGQLQPEQLRDASTIRVLDEIPEHIGKIEDLSVFQADSNAQYSSQLVPEGSYGKTGEYFLTKIEGLTVDEKGRVIVVNRGTNYASEVHVFNKDGTYLTPLGRSGRGPGEYIEPFFLQSNARKVYLYDVTGKRLNIYNADDFSFMMSSLEERWDIRDQKVIKGFNFGGFKVRDDGNILAEFYKSNFNKVTSRSKFTYLLMDMDGNKLDFEPFIFSGNLRIVTEENYPFPNVFPIGRTLTAMSNEGELFVANTQEFLIKKYDPTGAYQSAIYYPIKGAPLDFEEFLKSGRKFGPSIPPLVEVEKAFDAVGEELPKTTPVIDKLIVDDKNRIWVAVPIGTKSDIYEWWILAETGELLTKVVLPLEQPILDIKGKYLYSKKTNEETGEEYVIKYRLELTES